MGKMFLFYAVLSVYVINNVLASISGACQEGSLSCDDSKQCVLSEQWCDKSDDCEDKSDEAHCKEARWWISNPNDCKKEIHFLCSSGICVPKHSRCNAHDDCKDYSDELNCEEEEDKDSPEDTSEGTDESEEEENVPPDYEDEILVSKPDVITQSSTSSEPPSVISSSTSGYYDRRMKEIEAAKQGTSTLILSSSTQAHTTPTPSVTPSPNTRQRPTTSPDHPHQRQYTTPDYSRQRLSTSPDYIHRTTSSDHPHQRQYTSPDYSRQRQYNPDYPRQRPSTSHYYPHQSQTYDRRQQTFERRPYPPPSSPQTYNPQTQNRRPSTYDGRQQPYDRRPESNDRSSHVYGRNPQPYDRSSYDRRQQSYDVRSQTSNNHLPSYYNESRQYNSHRSIFSNRIPHPSYNRHSTVNHNALEPDWREVASLKPYSRLTEVNKPFQFAENYAEIYGGGNVHHVREGENWLLNQRNEAGDWGKDTARALVALALTNNSFLSGNSDYELMKRRFMVQLGVALLRNSSNELLVSRMAMAMNALFAVCENPRDFHALDLTELLRIRIRETVRKKGYPNPFVYLSLCLSGKALTDSEVQNLMKKMIPHSGTQDELSSDMQSLAIQAFSCYMQQVSSRDQAYRTSLQEKMDSAVTDLLSRMDEDGSFGSVYSTALAAQALISVNDSRDWNSVKTVNFLKQQQREDGSFGDLLATYYVLPVLSGHSLVHLRNIQCTPAAAIRDLTPVEILEFVGPKQFIHYSIYFGHPLASSHSLRVLVPEGINFLDVMKVAEYQNKNFRFSYETGDKNLNIYSISGTPNDIEQGLSWHLYVKDEADPNQKELNRNEQYSGDVREFFPTANKHVIFWYHPIGLPN